MMSKSPVLRNATPPPMELVEPRILRSKRSLAAEKFPATARFPPNLTVGVPAAVEARISMLWAEMAPLNSVAAPGLMIISRSISETTPMMVLPVVALSDRLLPLPVIAPVERIDVAFRRTSPAKMTGPPSPMVPLVVISESRATEVPALRLIAPDNTDLVNISMVAPVAVRLPTVEAMPPVPKPRR